MDGQTVSASKFRFNVSSRASRSVMGFVMVFALTLLTTHPMRAQTFSVLHYFNDGEDGANPYAGLTISPGGALYGTASQGGTYGDESGGTVFKLTPEGSSWVLSPLYSFLAGSEPDGGVVIGPNGALYGTTSAPDGPGHGTVFELTPPPTFCRAILCYWNETVLYRFTGTPDGSNPYGNLAFDRVGDIYGTTNEGGMYRGGTTFELTPSGGGYTESIIHSFGSGSDGYFPYADVVLDTAGNLYGTTQGGGTGEVGTVYQLMPSNGGWVENVLVNFDVTDGSYPVGNLIIDASGNLYGTTEEGGPNGGGVVFKLAPSDGGWTYSLLYSFSSCYLYGAVTIDTAGNLYGTCAFGGNTGGACGIDGCGSVFELTDCTQTCVANDLHDFSGSDGMYPYGSPVLDANGNLYGTTEYGGTGDCLDEGCGVVWEIAGVGAPRKN